MIMIVKSVIFLLIKEVPIILTYMFEISSMGRIVQSVLAKLEYTSIYVEEVFSCITK